MQLPDIRQAARQPRNPAAGRKQALCLLPVGLLVTLLLHGCVSAIYIPVSAKDLPQSARATLNWKSESIELGTNCSLLNRIDYTLIDNGINGRAYITPGRHVVYFNTYRNHAVNADEKNIRRGRAQHQRIIHDFHSGQEYIWDSEAGTIKSVAE